MVAEAGEGGGRGVRFYRRGNEWFCRSVLQSDIVVEVEGILFHLHKVHVKSGQISLHLLSSRKMRKTRKEKKRDEGNQDESIKIFLINKNQRFPLISKCGKIAHLVEDSQNLKDPVHYVLVECPGGPDGFFIAARFCYSTQVELTPRNGLMVYCTAGFLEMTEEYGNDNLLATAERFIHKAILRSWEDCILALQSSQQCIPEAENLPVVQKCLSALSMMACTDPSLFGWPMMIYGSLQSPGGSILWNGINTGARIRTRISDWWFEDVSCLNCSMFKKLMETMSTHGIRPENIVGALMYYSRKYLLGLDRRLSAQGGKRVRCIESLSVVPAAVDQKTLIESVVELLPEKKGRSYCRFLLGLLRLSIILDIKESCRKCLERKIGMQLEYATLDGLLVPNFSGSDNLYDTDCIERIIQHFLSFKDLNVAFFSPTSSDSVVLPSSNHLSDVTKVIDSYLSEVAPDVNLKPQKMRSLLEAFPESLRPLDDGMYRALDIYFKEHRWLPQNEKEQLCSIINWARLSINACTHASQNERLPLRIVLQVLFFEQMQLRRAISNCLHILDNDNNVTSTVNETAGEILQRDGWVSIVRENQHLKVDMEHLQSKVRELEQEFLSIKQEMRKVDKNYNLISSRRSISRKFGCMSVPQIDDAISIVIESTGPSPRISTKEPRTSRNSRHGLSIS